VLIAVFMFLFVGVFFLVVLIMFFVLFLVEVVLKFGFLEFFVI